MEKTIYNIVKHGPSPVKVDTSGFILISLQIPFESYNLRDFSFAMFRIIDNTSSDLGMEKAASLKAALKSQSIPIYAISDCSIH